MFNTEGTTRSITEIREWFENTVKDLSEVKGFTGTHMLQPKDTLTPRKWFWIGVRRKKIGTAHSFESVRVWVETSDTHPDTLWWVKEESNYFYLGD